MAKQSKAVHTKETRSFARSRAARLRAPTIEQRRTAAGVKPAALASHAERLSAAAHASGSAADHAAAKKAHDVALRKAAPGSYDAFRHGQASREHASAQHQLHPGHIERHSDHAHDGPKHHALMHGAKGGTFYINEHGHKVYGKK